MERLNKITKEERHATKNLRLFIVFLTMVLVLTVGGNKAFAYTEEIQDLSNIKRENLDGYKYVEIIERDIDYLKEANLEEKEITKQLADYKEKRKYLINNGYETIKGVKLYHPSEAAAMYVLDELITHRENLLQNVEITKPTTKRYLDALSSVTSYQSGKSYSVEDATIKYSDYDYGLMLDFLNKGYLPEKYRPQLNIYLLPFEGKGVSGFHQGYLSGKQGSIVMFGPINDSQTVIGTFFHELGHRVSTIDANEHPSGNRDLYWLEYMNRYGINNLNDIQMSWETSPKESYAEDTKAYLTYKLLKEKKHITTERKRTVYPMLDENYEELESIFQLEERFGLVNDEFEGIEISDWAKEPFIELIKKDIKLPEKEKYTTEATREEFTRLMVQSYAKINGVNLDYVAPAKSFNDTNDFYILKARQLGIADGVGYNNFKPNEKITREDAMVMIYKATKVKQKTDQEILFEDHHQISDYAKEAVGAMLSYEIVAGKEANKFYPQDTIKLEETIKIFDSFLKTF